MVFKNPLEKSEYFCKWNTSTNSFRNTREYLFIKLLLAAEYKKVLRSQQVGFSRRSSQPVAHKQVVAT